MIEPFEFQVAAAQVAAYRAIVTPAGPEIPRSYPEIPRSYPEIPRSYAVVPALLASRNAMTAVGWDPDAATLRHVAVDAMLTGPLDFGDCTVSTGITGLGRLGRGAGLAFSIRIEQHGRVVASLSSVIQSSDAAHLGTADPPDLDAAEFRLSDHVPTMPAPTLVERSTHRLFGAAEVGDYVELVGDRVALHHDPAVAQSQGLGHPIVPGYLTAAVMAELVASNGGAGLDGFGARFRHPVSVGVEVTIAWGPLGEGGAVAVAVSDQANDLVRGRVDMSVGAARNPGVR